MKISSTFDQIIPASTQQAIENASASAGNDEARISWANENTDEAPIYDVYDENDNYVFSIDTDGNVIFER